MKLDWDCLESVWLVVDEGRYTSRICICFVLPIRGYASSICNYFVFYNCPSSKKDSIDLLHDIYELTYFIKSWFIKHKERVIHRLSKKKIYGPNGNDNRFSHIKHVTLAVYMMILYLNLVVYNFLNYIINVIYLVISIIIISGLSY